MRMFFYYAFHSVKNQLKKLFKTWVLIFLLACMLFGGIIGLGIGIFADNTIPDDDYSYSEEYEEDELEEDVAFPEEIKDPAKEFTELAVGLGSVVILFLCCLGADKSGNAIFLPADVNLLFSAPLKPQSVLMFRLMTQIGTILLSSLYISFNIPNLVMNLGLSVWAAIGFIMALLIIMSFGKLLQVLLYLIASTNAFIKKHLRTGLFAVLLLIACGFYLYSKTANPNDFGDYILAALRFFNHPATRFIPIIGCLKMFCVHIVAGNALGVIINLLGIILTGALVLFAISNVKADFYEEALAKSQETAELQQIAQQQTGFAKRKKDRSVKLKRDALERGEGAGIFFWKAMYNRFRFAHFKVFTKTSETYLLIAIVIAVICKSALDVNGFIATMLIIGGCVFFRTLGNPLEEDTSKDFFRLIPEKTINKLFWSVLAGSVNCLLDIIPAILVSAVVFSVNPLSLIPWALLIISVDFYGTTVGAFINISVPVNAGSMIKQLVQILFIYFGLLPDAGIIVLSFVLKAVPVGVTLCALANLALGAIFLALIPSFIDFAEKTPKK